MVLRESGDEQEEDLENDAEGEDGEDEDGVVGER